MGSAEDAAREILECWSSGSADGILTDLADVGVVPAWASTATEGMTPERLRDMGDNARCFGLGSIASDLERWADEIEAAPARLSTGAGEPGEPDLLSPPDAAWLNQWRRTIDMPAEAMASVSWVDVDRFVSIIDVLRWSSSRPVAGAGEPGPSGLSEARTVAQAWDDSPNGAAKAYRTADVLSAAILRLTSPESGAGR